MGQAMYFVLPENRYRQKKMFIAARGGHTHHCRLSTLNNFQLISGDILPIDFSSPIFFFFLFPCCVLLIDSVAIVIVSHKLLVFIYSPFFPVMLECSPASR
jgi:hypothetical protein